MIKIELKDIPECINITNFIIRDIKNTDEDGELCDGPHFQATIVNNSEKTEEKLHFTVTYYFENNGFAGLDNYSKWIEDYKPKAVLPVNMPLCIPENATKAVVTIELQYEKKGFYYWSGRLLMVASISLLAAWILKTMGWV